MLLYRTSEVWQDNVPMWEKKFCYVVGRMPWKKVLSTKNFMSGHNIVLNWDDLAGKEAFHTAKKRFWDEINGIPCETQLPNPDMYIDEIDWNPYIDPNLAKELDRAFFNPDDKYYLPSASRSKDNCGWPDDATDPWEYGRVRSCTEKNKAPGWGQWDNSVNATSKSNKDDPWESCIVNENGAVTDKAIGWNQWDNSGNHTSKPSTDFNPWENHCIQGNEDIKDNTWRGERNTSWGLQPNTYSDMSKNGSANANSWRNESSGWKDCGASSRSWNQETGRVPFTSYWSTSNKNKREEYSSYRGSRMPNGRSNQWGHKPRDRSNWGPKDSVNIHRGQGQFNAGCRKREGPDHYVANHKGPRLQGDDQPYFWNGGNDKRPSYAGQ